MCRELSGIQRLTPARTLPGPNPSKGKTCIAACPSACRDYFLISPKLHIQAVHRAYLAHRLPASLPTPHHVAVHGVPAPGHILQYQCTSPPQQHTNHLNPRVLFSADQVTNLGGQPEKA